MKRRKTKVIEIDILCQGEFKLLIKCNWRTCKNYKDGVCRADSIELKSFDYEEDNEELEGLKCATYEYDSFGCVIRKRSRCKMIYKIRKL